MKPSEPKKSVPDLRALLPHGSITYIAHRLEMSRAAVTKALRKGRPSHPAVAEAVRLIKEAGSQAVQQDLSQLTR
ncbi:hypothetical protein E5K00_14590 [Hymenobacter aquaticus]|uniref:Uncharacterized protein n=1 Tax=Hymenobacter aquaticus TaxID=1867101 RepID=A0A4Z0PX53_9BACT|nr:hypothetical protein [Hymenobacter aquaticus]TGE21511.1 hypothetical protein E5K00_14590 [Hymenobacter aquaticus]